MRSVQSTLFALLVASGATYAETTLNLTSGVSPVSRDIYELHMTVLWVCVVIGVGVFGAMFYSIIKHRRTVHKEPAKFHSHFWLEVTWTIIPAIILVVMAIPATRVLLNINNDDKEEVTIKITGYQWKWHYEYLEDGVSFFSNLSTPITELHNQAPKGEFYLREVDNPVVVPIHKKIRFLITSNDVNHSWWVPDLGVKRDALAGFINEAWTIIDKPGTYRGQCAELCGINHAFMPIVVVAVTEQGYADWIAKQKGQATQGEAEVNKEWTMQELMKQGEQVYSRICAACHQQTGAGLPPTFPALKGSKIATGPIEGHVNIVFNGKNGTAMQAFKSQLSDTELACVITYERNAFGNDTKTLVQPIQMKTLREGKSMAEALATKPSGIPNAVPQTMQPVTPAASKTTPSTGGGAPVPSASVAASPVASSSAAVPSAAVPSAAAPSAAAPSAAEPHPAETLHEAMEHGEKIYMTTCAICHQPNGQGMPPTFPALKDSVIVKGPVSDHIDRVLNGKLGTAMVAFKDQFNDQDLADVITYERNAWGNNTGVLVKPDDIKAARTASQSQNNK